MLPRLLVVLALWLPVPAALYGLHFYGSLVPLHEAPAAIDVPIGEVPSRVVSARGFQVGGLERGGAAWVPFDGMSDAFVRAVVANEDARFFYHPGFDPEGIARAFRTNLQSESGLQGGSTITQQLAKSFVGDERTFARKLVELVVARKIEDRFAKTEIFAAYANRAYFGAGAQGVGAAARVFFGVRPDELTLAQSALLAAMIPAPGRYNPFVHPEAALERRDRVLDRLFETGFATEAEVEAARAAPLGVRSRPEVRVHAPEIDRATWAALSALDDTIDWRRGDLRIDTAIDLVRQRVAQASMRTHLYALDQRQGLRETAGVVSVVAGVPDAVFVDAWRAAYEDAPPEVVPAVVTDVDDAELTVWAGNAKTLDATAWSWAVPYRQDARNHAETIESPADAFAVGDLVLLHDTLGVVQFPRVEGAYAAVDVADGTFEALVGGFDPDRSDFDRVTHGCRQPGSTFKPIVYSAALDLDYTPATLLRDAPLRIELGPFEEWRPRNADGSFEGHITLWQALVWSRNLTTLAVYRDIGSGRTIRRARDLGLTTPLDAVESLALGASCVYPAELLTVYGSFADGGFGASPRLVTRIHGPSGRLVFEAQDGHGLGLGPLPRTAHLWRDRAELPGPRVSRRNAFQIAWLLTQVVQSGTASDLRALSFDVAGKTGTTNAYDAWFAGFSARDVAVAWIGSDRNTRALGRSETGGHLALPAWRDAQLTPVDDTPLLPAPPPSIEWVDIEPESGRLAAEDRWAIPMPFRLGTAPTLEATTRERLDRLEIDRLERTF